MCYFFLLFSKQNISSLNNDRSRQSKLPNLPPQALKNLWIRTALMEKLLDKIVLYLVENSRYNKIFIAFVIEYIAPCMPIFA